MIVGTGVQLVSSYMYKYVHTILFILVLFLLVLFMRKSAVPVYARSLSV